MGKEGEWGSKAFFALSDTKAKSVPKMGATLNGRAGSVVYEHCVVRALHSVTKKIEIASCYQDSSRDIKKPPSNILMTFFCSSTSA